MEIFAENQRPDIDNYFMNIAVLVSSRATCLRRKVGAVIVKGKQIVSTGYNGAPQGLPHCLDIGCAREGIPSGERTELCRGAHAEQNAINFAARFGISIEGATVYSTHLPCSWCAKSIINSGIKRVVYLVDYPDQQSKEIMKNIKVERIENFKIINIDAILSTYYQQGLR
ncbi:MAG: cytidine deaminase [Spirochaetes bacterium]|nr:MAG: cytidine deaminase [Spirochaetota bacterium]